MPYRILADILVLIHLGFVMFVVAGGLLVLRWPRAVWVHVPSAIWGIAVEWAGWICPLTPLEQWLRRQAGGAAYEGDFMARYVFPLLYPAALTRDLQVLFGAIALAMNVAVYAVAWRVRRRKRELVG